VANSFYSASITEPIIQNVIDFFNETWKTKPKPFKYNELIASQKQLPSLDGCECRNTSIQSTYIIEKFTGNFVYNLRKIRELPNFIVKLNPDIALPLICEQIYFNYQFLNGLITSCEYLEFVMSLLEFIKGSSVFVAKENEKALTDLRLIAIIIIQIGSIMTDFPNSAMLELLGTSINFYGLSKYFTKLVDEYDRESVLNCSLLLTGQHSDKEVRQVIIQFDKHLAPITHVCLGGKENKTFVFTLSSKLHILRFHGFKVFGEVQFGNEVKFKSMLVYFNNSSTYDDVTNNLLSNISGGFILATSEEIRFFTFANLAKPCVLQMPADHIFQEMNFITPNHLAVILKNQPYLNIYNIHSQELVQQFQLRGAVKMSVSNLRKGYIVSFNEIVKQDVYLVVLYEDTDEVDVFKLILSDLNEVDMLINKQNDSFSLRKVHTLSPFGTTPGHRVNSFDFCKIERIVNTEHTLVVGLKNGNFARIELKKNVNHNNDSSDNDTQQPICEMTYCRLSERISKSPVKMLEALKDAYLFFEKKTGKLFVYILNRTGVFIVNLPGTYEDGFFVRDYKVAGVVNGNLHIYLIIYDEQKSYEENENQFHYYFVIKLMEFNYHYDKLSSHYVHGKC
jgi:hypothetical protein